MLLGLSDAEDRLSKYIFKEGKAQRTSYFTNPQTLSFFCQFPQGMGRAGSQRGLITLLNRDLIAGCYGEG